MKRKLAIIHTTPVTIEPLKLLASKIIQECEIVNFLDDSILPQLIKNGGKIEEVDKRWIQYVQIAESIGANCVLSACSSVGEIVYKAQEFVKIPVLRIDEGMADIAIKRGTVIGVAATLSTTLNPTISLLQSKAKAAGKTIEIKTILSEEAYKCLMNGEKDKHDAILAEALAALANEVDVVVLAQASMARVVEGFSQEEKEKFLSSPRLGMERVKLVLEGTI